MVTDGHHVCLINLLVNRVFPASASSDFTLQACHTGSYPTTQGTSDPALSSQPPQNAACGAGPGGGNRCHLCWPRSDPGSVGWTAGRVLEGPRC